VQRAHRVPQVEPRPTEIEQLTNQFSKLAGGDLPLGWKTRIALRSVLDSVRDVFIRMQRLPPKPYERGGDDPASSSALKSPTPTRQQPLPALQNATLKLGRTRRPGSINWSALRSQEPRAISEVGWRRAFSVLATRSAASRDPRAS
jgi:hypothetical protein